MLAFIVAVGLAAVGYALARRASPSGVAAERVRIAAVESELGMFGARSGLYANLARATGTLRDHLARSHAVIVDEAARLKARGWPARESAVLLLRARRLEREVSAGMGLRSQTP